MRISKRFSGAVPKGEPRRFFYAWTVQESLRGE